MSSKEKLLKVLGKGEVFLLTIVPEAEPDEKQTIKVEVSGDIFENRLRLDVSLVEEGE